MQEIFRFRIYNDTESNLGPKVWELVQHNLKSITSLNSFNEQIKKWNPENRPCRLCKTYSQHVDFINKIDRPGYHLEAGKQPYIFSERYIIKE